MKTCTICEQIRPDESFYRGGAWCQDCRVAKRSEWKAKNPANDKARKLLANQEPDPTAYGKLHCEHISNYTKRAIERFEKRTGNEAPPELTAIYQLARRLTDQQQAQLITRAVSRQRECIYCGRVYTPRLKYSQKWCSPACRHRAKDEANPEATRQRKLRHEARLREANAPAVAARKARGERRRAIKAQAKEQARVNDTRWLHLAQQAADLRRQGLGWQQIADTLGYAGPGSAYTAIRLRLHIDPRTLTPSSRSATT